MHQPLDIYTSRITPENAADMLESINADISDVEQNLSEYRAFLSAHPRAFGRNRIEDHKRKEQKLLKKLMRRQEKCHQFTC